MKRQILMALCGLLAAFGAQAQIGYQVAVMDQTKGTPKANETVSVTVTITDNAGNTICSETQSGTTDEFGILSMQIGSASTFSNVNWSKLPLWVSAKVGDVTISKTQILSVPVAEHAKHTGSLTKEILKSKTWACNNDDGGKSTLSFGDLTVTYHAQDDYGWSETLTYSYSIDGNAVLCYTNGGLGRIWYYVPGRNILVNDMSTYR